MEADGNTVNDEMDMMENYPCPRTVDSAVLGTEALDQNKDNSQQIRLPHSVDSPIGLLVSCLQQRDGVSCGSFVAWLAYNHVSNVITARIPRAKTFETKTERGLLSMEGIDLEMVRREFAALVDKKFGDGRWKCHDKGKTKMDGEYGMPTINYVVEFDSNQELEISGPDSKAKIGGTKAELDHLMDLLMRTK
ncbi:hypothetical protein EAF00_012018 [Botryotinia globosa]|nr:hypothetical protein EAF00_012018 [Botryotinia globosa]